MWQRQRKTGGGCPTMIVVPQVEIELQRLKTKNKMWGKEDDKKITDLK